MNSFQTFIIIDDDPVNNLICEEMIKLNIKFPHSVFCFTNPQAALGYIEKEYSNHSENSITTLFLDINMPIMSGWEFLEKFSLLKEEIKKAISIYIISSSINPQDKEKADANPYVKDFIVKPISEEFLLANFAFSGENILLPK